MRYLEPTRQTSTGTREPGAASLITLAPADAPAAQAPDAAPAAQAPDAAVADGPATLAPSVIVRAGGNE